MMPTRRLLLKALTGTALVWNSLLRPLHALAEWQQNAFSQRQISHSLQAIGAEQAQESEQIVLIAPTIAENGAMVPVSVHSHIPHTEQIFVLVDKNPFPLAAQFTFQENALPEVALRLKFGESSNVRAIVIANGQAYQTQRAVKITVGGCGG